MNIEITIKAPELAEAINHLADAMSNPAAVKVVAAARVTKVEGSEITIPAGTPLTVTDVQPAQEPEKPKARKRAAAKAPETPQEAPTVPEAPQAAEVPAAPEKPAESAPAAPTAPPVPTIDQIVNAGARLIDSDATKMPALLALLSEYGVQAVPQLKPEQLPSFAEKLRGLGAEV